MVHKLNFIYIKKGLDFLQILFCSKYPFIIENKQALHIILKTHSHSLPLIRNGSDFYEWCQWQ